MTIVDNSLDPPQAVNLFHPPLHQLSILPLFHRWSGGYDEEFSSSFVCLLPVEHSWILELELPVTRERNTNLDLSLFIFMKNNPIFQQTWTVISLWSSQRTSRYHMLLCGRGSVTPIIATVNFSTWQYLPKDLNVTMGQLYGHLKSASHSAIGKLSWGRFAQLLSNCKCNPNKRKLVPDSVNRNYYTPWEFEGCINKKKAISALKWRSFYRLILVWNGYIIDRYRRNVGINFWGGHVVLVGRQITIAVTTDRRYHYTKYPNTDFGIAGWGGRTGLEPPETGTQGSSLTSTPA